MRTVHAHPNQLQLDGRPVLSTFSGGENLRAIRDRLEAEELPIAIVPYVFPLPPKEHPRGREIDAVFNRLPWVDGFFFFGGPGTGEQIARSTALLAAKWLGSGRIFMAGITPYYRGLGGNYRVFETLGFEGMARQWESAIHMRVPWAQIVTWNDWGEATYVAPFGRAEDTRLWDGHWGPLPSHTAYLDASRHYIEWFKTGVEPAIDRDRLYYFYRPHAKRLEGVVTPGEGRHGRPSGAAKLKDAVFVTVFLPAPARLTILTGKEPHVVALPSGVSHTRVPLRPGRPRFVLERDGRVIIDKTGEHEILATDAWANFNTFAGGAEGAIAPSGQAVGDPEVRVP
jgi:hypothetical protein